MQYIYRYIYAYRIILLIIALCMICTTLILVVTPPINRISFVDAISLLMGYFVSILAFLKLLDISAFARGFTRYDLIAQKWSTWCFIYPFLELAIGIAFLGLLYPKIVGVIAFVLGGIGTISISYALYIPSAKHTSSKPLACACTGGKLDVPLGVLSILENVAMALMGLGMLLFM